MGCLSIAYSAQKFPTCKLDMCMLAVLQPHAQKGFVLYMMANLGAVEHLAI